MACCAAAGTKEPAFDHARLAASLSSATGERYAAATLPFEEITFDPDGGHVRFAVAGTGWRCSTTDYVCRSTGPAPERMRRGRRGEAPYPAGMDAGDDVAFLMQNPTEAPWDDGWNQGADVLDVLQQQNAVAGRFGQGGALVRLRQPRHRQQPLRRDAAAHGLELLLGERAHRVAAEVRRDVPGRQEFHDSVRLLERYLADGPLPLDGEAPGFPPSRRLAQVAVPAQRFQRLGHVTSLRPLYRQPPPV